MSLVLEALKKLDREKGQPERGFVVMAATPWPVRAVRRWPLWALLALGVAAASWALLARRPAAVLPPLAAPPTSTAVTTAAAPAAVPDVSEIPAARVPITPRAAARASNTGTAGAAGVPTVAPPAAQTSIPESPPSAAKPAAATAADHTDHAAAAAHGPRGLRLQAISQRDGQPIAILSDRLVRVGDEFDGVRVLAIREAEVDVEFQGQRTTLRF